MAATTAVEGGAAEDKRSELTSAEKSDSAKALANDAFKAGDHKLAVKKYGIALKHAERAEEGQKKPDTLETNRTATVLANRCMAYLSLGDLDAALADAAAAVKAAPGWPKAHFRHGSVLMKKGAHMKAYAAFKQGWHLDTSNDELTKACQQAHQAMMGFAQQDKVMSQEDLFKMRSGKLEEEYRQKTEKQKLLVNGGGAPLMATAPGAPVADRSYREEALMRTAKMANPRLPEEIAAREAAVRQYEAEKAAERASEESARADADAMAETASAPQVAAGITEAAATKAAAPAAPAVPAPRSVPPTSSRTGEGRAGAPDAEEAGATSTAAAAAVDAVDVADGARPAAVPEYALSRTSTAGEDADAAPEEQLVLTVRTPLVASIKGLDLSVGPESVELTALDPSLYRPLLISLPATVDGDRAHAKFDRKARVLTVRLPIVGLVV